MRLRPALSQALHGGPTSEDFFGNDITPATSRTGAGAAVWRPTANAPRILVSSTSWTPDEDFGVRHTAPHRRLQDPRVPWPHQLIHLSMRRCFSRRCSGTIRHLRRNPKNSRLCW